MAMPPACFSVHCANEHPDHDTIGRRRAFWQIETLFVQVLGVAREMGVLKLGTVALDGTKIHVSASRHSALSYEHASKIEAQLQAEVADLLRKAEAADQADVPDGMSIPEELARREARLATIARAKATIEARAKERHGRGRAEYEARLKAREAKTAATGKKLAGRPPAAPVEGPRPTDQVNLTDEESRIMPVAGGGFEQCYNAQAMVAADSLLMIAAEVVQAPNDKQQLEPMLGKLADLPDELGRAEALLADNGYFSESNANACAAAGITPVTAMGREAHHPTLDERFAGPPPSPPKGPTPLEAMDHRLKTPEGKKLYALRQFLLRGLDNVRGEWNLVTMAWNVKRIVLLVDQGTFRRPDGVAGDDLAKPNRTLSDDFIHPSRAASRFWPSDSRVPPVYLRITPNSAAGAGTDRCRRRHWCHTAHRGWPLSGHEFVVFRNATCGGTLRYCGGLGNYRYRRSNRLPCAAGQWLRSAKLPSARGLAASARMEADTRTNRSGARQPLSQWHMVDSGGVR